MSAPRQRHARSAAGLRLPRAAVFAAVCVVLSAAGHVLGSTATVPLWTLTLGFLAVFCVAAPLAGRERSLPGIAALQGAGQIALHTLFGLGQHSSMAMGPAEPSVVQRAARLMCGAGASALSPVQAQRILDDAGVPSGPAHHHMTGVAGAMALMPSLPMLLGHLVAAAGAGWLLRRGDLALSGALRLSRASAQCVAEGALVRSLRAALALVRVLRAGLAEAFSGPGCVPRAAFPAPPRLRAVVLQHSVSRRGPPAGSAFLLAA